MSKFLGMPSDGGMHSFSNNRSANGSGEMSGRGGAAVGANASNRNASQFSVPRGAAAGAAVANRNSPQFSGAESAAAGAAVANRNSPQFSGAGGAAAGRAAGSDGGFGYMSPSDRYGAAYGAREGFGGYGLYTPGWFGANSGAWVAGGLATAAWNGANWNSMNGWLGYDNSPVDYNYGSNVVTQDDNVYVDGQDAGTTQEYYDQAASLAKTGADAPATDDQNWLPLGVFAMTHARPRQFQHGNSVGNEQTRRPTRQLHRHQNE